MKNIFAADIGGTNSRFAHFTLDEKEALVLNGTRWLETDKSTSFSHLLGLLNQSEFSLAIDQSDMTVLAVAGPTIDGIYSDPPNIPWDIDLAAELADFNPMRCLLINDFVAQAYACRSPVIRSARPIISGRIDPGAPLAVVGAGTGLGMAALIPDGHGGYVAVPSEGGHCVFPFETQAELEFMQFVMEELHAPYVETEFVVSGKGLSLIHQYLAGEKLTPAEVGAAAARDSKTLEWAARFYGRACRNYALQVLARGGIYIAGGVARRAPGI
jgi:glucokinase